MSLDDLYEETWMTIPNYPDYQISTLGRIRKGEILLKPFINYGHGSRYLRIKLTRDGKRSCYYVHRLVAMTFLDQPKDAEFVNHKNRDTFNNAVHNLEWCTPLENYEWSREYEPAF